MKEIGRCRVDEEFFPVTAIRLVRGGLAVEFEAQGPRERPVSGPVRLFTPNHEPVTEWAEGETMRVEIPELARDETCRVVWTVIFDSFKART